MSRWKKPENPPATLTRTDSEGLPENKTELTEAGQRTRPPFIQGGTWGDRVFEGSRHTSDPKAPKLL